MLKIAVASSDGITINEHFAQARQFLIFEVDDDGTHRQVETRKIIDEGEAAFPSREEAIARLAGVDAVLASQIGPGAVESLQARGIRAFGVKGDIDRALASYGKRHKLLGRVVLGIPHGCGPGSRCGGRSGKSCR